jgi:hypothetical protein
MQTGVQYEIWKPFLENSYRETERQMAVYKDSKKGKMWTHCVMLWSFILAK